MLGSLQGVKPLPESPAYLPRKSWSASCLPQQDWDPTISLLHVNAFSHLSPDVLLVVEGPAQILSWHLRNVGIEWKRFKSPFLTPNNGSLGPVSLSLSLLRQFLPVFTGSTWPYSSPCFPIHCYLTHPAALLLEEAFTGPSCPHPPWSSLNSPWLLQVAASS